MHRKSIVSIWTSAFVAAAVLVAPVKAAPKPWDEKKTCESLDGAQQLILERRAIGGDKAAQIELARCAASVIGDTPPVQLDLTSLSYAFMWTATAYCDRFFNPMERELEADPVTVLKRNAWVSKRPDEREPGGDPTQQFRRKVQKEDVELREMWARVTDAMTQRPELAEATQKAFVKRFAGLGPSGLVALANMRNCPAIGRNPRLLEAAYWVAAQDGFKGVRELGRKGSLRALVPPAYAAITAEDDATLVEKMRRDFGLSSSVANDAAVADLAALGRMGEAPVQYLQIALGAFRNRPGFASSLTLVGPFEVDNLYGAATSRLVQMAQGDPRIIGDIFAKVNSPKVEGAALAKPPTPTGYLTPRE
ncbi:MAG: hypothetical protein K2Q06_01950, partial [Parvularculaceae bacterium]|nr:hypothetical protein [Parvularculaceae bacterium]